MSRKIKNRLSELVWEREQRERRRITNTEIAQATGISQNLLTRWMSNKITRFDSDVVVRLCYYFGCGVSDLLIIEDSENPEESAPAFAIAS